MLIDPAKPTPSFPLLIAEILVSGCRSIDLFTAAVLVGCAAAWVLVYQPDTIAALFPSLQ
jgi:hypothetical protein